MSQPRAIQWQMAQMTPQQVTAPSRSGGPIYTAGSSITSNSSNPHPPPGQIAQSRDNGPSSSVIQRDGNAVPTSRTLFWNDVFPRIANTCGVFGLLLAVIFGVTQWLAQDKSIAIAKESELITPALSCSDEKTKNTTVCQQFFEKYLGGPTISRRGNFSLGNLHYQDSNEPWSAHVALEYIAVHLASATRFFQEQNSRFQSTLETIELSPTQIGGIIGKTGKSFSQIMAALMPISTCLQAENASYIPTAAWFISRSLIAIVAALLVAWVVFLLTSEFGIFLFIGVYACMVDPMIGCILLGVNRLAKLLASSVAGLALLYAGFLDLLSAQLRSYIRRTVLPV
ncbi:hypothetical protein HD806DRAFT_490499 [Xylariaceae sp. AK1471]|nr:hypothetical protein HD806DRAFT_490499 [Xylariaceae sp. AK1471]